MTDKTSPYRMALNTIQWFATEDGHIDRTKGPSPHELSPIVRDLGFAAVPAKTPEGTSVEQMQAILAAGGLQPAPSAFNVGGPEDGTSFEEALAQVRRSAAKQAELGVTEAFIIPSMDRTVRIHKPAVGAGFDAGRLDEMTHRVGRIAEVALSEGIRCALHSHVGTWIETEAELRHVLKAIDDKTLWLGPDTGHLSWVGVDVVSFFGEFAERVVAMHLKDIRLDIRDRALRLGTSYGETALMGLWAEPGLGHVDLAGAIGALGHDFDGWVVVEVDRPTMDPFKSAQHSAKWLRGLKRLA